MARPVARHPRAAAAGLPPWIRPQLTQLVDQAPDGPEWLHEIKFDGYRMHARLDRGAAHRCTTPITRPGMAARSTRRPAPWRLRASSRNAPMPLTRLAIAACGSR